MEARTWGCRAPARYTEAQTSSHAQERETPRPATMRHAQEREAIISLEIIRLEIIT